MFLVEITTFESATYPYKTAKLTYQKPMLRQIERGIQDGLITKNADLSQTTQSF